MSEIHEAKIKIIEFMSNELGKEQDAIRVLKLAKSKEGWEGKIEVTEQNEYLKKIGYPAIFDKNIYTVKLDPELNIAGYAQTAARERTYETEEREEL